MTPVVIGPWSAKPVHNWGHPAEYSGLQEANALDSICERTYACLRTAIYPAKKWKTAGPRIASYPGVLASTRPAAS